MPTIYRTSTSHPHFQELIRLLDKELWEELHEDQATYEQHNLVPDIETAVIAYMEKIPAASGCFKILDQDRIEIKRMYVRKEFRGCGLSRAVLGELETWARALGYRSSLLETSIHFKVAQSLYRNFGYQVIENYGPYYGLPESVCMKKNL